MINPFEKFCNKIDYKTYEDINNILMITGGSIYLSNFFLYNNNLEVSTFLSALSLYLMTSGIIMKNSDGIKNTKDYKELDSLYSEFINNYCELNKIFYLYNPIEIMILYNYMLYNGYLSNNKKFEFKDIYKKEINGLEKLNIIDGNGVCRHISYVLNDILRKESIFSYRLEVHLNNIEYDIIEDKNGIDINSLKFKASDAIKDDEVLKEILKYIETLDKNKKYKLIKEIVKDGSLLNQKIGNHAINLCVKDNIIYYLDPTHKIIYHKESNILHSEEIDAEIKLLSSFILNTNTSYFELKKLLDSNYSSEKENKEKTYIKRVNNKIKNNLDILESFYYFNRELYSEISYKLNKIRK